MFKSSEGPWDSRVKRADQKIEGFTTLTSDRMSKEQEARTCQASQVKSIIATLYPGNGSQHFLHFALGQENVLNDSVQNGALKKESEEVWGYWESGCCFMGGAECICMQINVPQSPTYIPLQDNMPIYHFKWGIFSCVEMLEINLSAVHSVRYCSVWLLSVIL